MENYQKGLISVVVPVYNMEKYIDRALESLLSQTYENYEIIIVDDASTDHSQSLIEKWAKPRNNVKDYYLKEKDITYKGKKAALKLATDHAEFEFLLFTDADCEPHPNWIKSMNNCISETTGMVIGSYYEINAPIIRRFSDKITAAFFGITTNIGIPYSCSGMNMLIRKEAFIEVGGYDRIKHHLAGDDKLMLNLINKTNWKIVYNPEKIMASTSENDRQSNHQQRLRKYGKFRSSRPIIKIISIVLFLYYLCLLLLPILQGFSSALLIYSGAIFFFWLVNLIVHSFKFRFIELFMLYLFPYFLIYYTIAGMISRWEWKGQTK